MSEQIPNTPQNPNPDIPGDQDALIPPFYLLIVGVVGLVVALVVALTQPQFSVVGWGGLGLGILSLVAWIFMAPEQAKAIVTGRTARYGGTTLVVTILFLTALVAIYGFVKGRNIRIDLTQRDDFSLNDQTREAIAGLAVEPKVPNIKIYAFYGAVQAGQRDRDTILLDDYVKTSQNKISYEFVDPDRSPVLAQSFEVTRAGQLVVAPLDANGQPLTDKAELVNFISQEQLSNTILKVAAAGDFRGYFLSVDDGIKLTDTSDLGMSQMNDLLKNRYNWNTQEVKLIDLTSPSSSIKLNDPVADGEVLVIVGGSKALPDEQVKFITDYLDQGGNLVIFAAPLNGDGSASLATADNLNTYLFDKFGMKFINNLVIDQTQAFQSPFFPASISFDSTSYITSDFARGAQSFMIFETPHSIEVAETPPAGVTVTRLANSSADAYAKTDPVVLQATDESQIAQVDTDAKGPFVFAASAENSSTGGRVVLVGSLQMPTNQYSSLLGANVVNLEVAVRALFWGSNYSEFFSQIPQVQTQTRPQDTPVFVDAQTSRNINFLIIIIIPFGILLLGGLVWWNNRERAH